MQTLSQFQRSSGVNVLGNCANSAQGLSKLNDAIERCMSLGDWSGLILPVQLCVNSGCVVLPRYVSNVRKLNVCNSPTNLQNFWYQFQPRECNYNFARGWDSGASAWWGPASFGRYCGAQCTALQYGTTQTFDSIRGEGRLIRAYHRCNADAGKTITFYGIDDNGQPLMTRDSDDNYTEGITLVLQKPFTSSSVFVRRIDRVVREATQCPVNIFAYWAAEDALEPIAQYDGAEVVPEYARLQIQVGCNNNCNGVKSIMALVKLRFVPVVNPDDFVLIDNLGALKAMIQSNDYSEQGNLAAADQFEQKAIRLLNRQLADDFPLDSIPVQIATFNNTGVGRQRCW